MDDVDRAQAQEEMARENALAAARNHSSRDLESELCTGCDYATRNSFGKRCDGWADCLQDLQRRERSAGAFAMLVSRP